jgi:hypothetical protein
LKKNRASLVFNDNILSWFKDYLDSDKNIALVSSLLLDGRTMSFEGEVNRILSLEAERNQLLLSVTPRTPQGGNY